MSVRDADGPIRSRPAIVAAACALFVTTMVWRFLTFAGFSNDHYAHFALAQQMLLGERPIRDFADPGWPLTYMLSAGMWQLFGGAMSVEWTVVALSLAAGAAFTFLTAYKLAGSLWIAVLVTLLELIVYPRTYSYPKLLVYAVGAWLMISSVERPSRRRLVVMSAAIAAAFLLRHDHGLYLGVAAAVCVMLASRGDGWRAAFGRTAVLTAATASWLVPWMLFVMANGGLVAYFDRALEYAREEQSATTLRAWPRITLVPGKPLLGLERPDRPLAQVRWSPSVSDAERLAMERQYSLDYVRDTEDARWYYVGDPSEANIRALADDPRAAATSNLGRVSRPFWREFLAYVSPFRLAPALHSPANADAWLYWLFWGLPVACAALVIIRLRKNVERWRGELAVVAGLSVMTALVNDGFLRDLLRDRLADAVVPPALIGAWALGLCWGQPWRRRAWQVVVQLFAMAAVVASVGASMQIGSWTERIEYAGVGDGLEGVFDRAHKSFDLLALPHRQHAAPPSRVALALMPFFAYVDRCSTTSDQLIVTGDFPEVPVLAGRAFASDGVVLGSWYSSARHQEATAEELKSQPPLFVVFLDGVAFQARYPSIAAFVRDQYVSVAEVPVDGSGTVVILTPRARMPASTDEATGWPCFK
jgi:hypothetical protein